VSRDRGIDLQRATARILARWWPNAETNPNGRGGRDILGTPGVWWEVKTSFKGTSPGAAIRQACMGAHAVDDVLEVPVVLYWPPGVGEKRPDQAIAMMAFPDVMHLLESAGYAPEPKEEV